MAEHYLPFFQAIYYVTFHFARAVLAFLQRDSYLYWPFILSTLLIALMVARGSTRAAGKSWSGQLREYLSARIWWHPSARADYRLYFANALLLPLILAWVMFSDAQIVTLIDWALGRATTQGTPGDAGMLGRLAYTLLFFVAYDFGRFVAHCLLHDVPALWEFHKVHHSALVLTPMTAYRIHPVEGLIMAWVPALTTGLATWLFNLFTAGQVAVYTFLGLHVILWMLNLIDNLRHSNVWITYGSTLGRWIVSPAAHQLHHSYEPRHLGCNRGFSLAVWDRIYGTLYVPPARQENFRIGLGDGTEAEWQSVSRMYYKPVLGFLARIRDLLRRPAAQ